MTRTYGSFKYCPATAEPDSEEYWELRVEPALATRLKHIIRRIRTTQIGTLTVKHTLEVARDLQWLMNRWPLTPQDPRSKRVLNRAARAHHAREQAVNEILSKTATPTTLPLPPLTTPRDYQLEAVHLLRTTGRLLLTDEVGLGKTLTGLLNATYDDALPMVIVPPTHLPRRWETEIKESLPWLTFQTVKKTTPSPSWTPQELPDVLIVPYSRLAGWHFHLAGHIKTIIFDEFQDLRRGTDTSKGRAAAALTLNTDYAMGMTATPIYNYGGEAWELMNILAPDQLGTKQEFIREWGHNLTNSNIHVNSPAALGSYLKEQGLMLGHTRKEVHRELPQVIKVAHTVDSDPVALEHIKGDAVELAKLILNDTTSGTERFKASGDLDWKLREATGIAKAPYVAEFVRLLLESEQKVVLFGWHRAVYDIWMSALKEFHPVMYTGSESPTQKAAAEETFTQDPRCRIMILSLRSGAGIDGLQRVCRTAVFGELDWSPQVHTQGIGRLNRDGMGEEPVVAYYLTTDDGSDPVILDVLGIKRLQGEQFVSPTTDATTQPMPDQSRARRLAEALLRKVEISDEAA